MDGCRCNCKREFFGDRAPDLFVVKYLKNFVRAIKTHAINDNTKSTLPIVKKITAEPRGSDTKVIVTISMIAVKTPPSA